MAVPELSMNTSKESAHCGESFEAKSAELQRVSNNLKLHTAVYRRYVERAEQCAPARQHETSTVRQNTRAEQGIRSASTISGSRRSKGVITHAHTCFLR